MKKELKILHIEDNLTDAMLIERALKKAEFKFVINVIETKKEFINALHSFKPDVILSDHSLPQFDSMEALSIYNEKNCEVPFILITGSVSEEFAIRSMKEGADDYILKNNLIRLPSAIKQALKARQIESEKRRAYMELEAANKELNTFIYKAAHDLRGPLCSIMGLTNVACLENEKNNLADYITKISESTYKLDAVLLSLINVMAIKDSKLVLKEINFNTIVSTIIERLKTTEGYNSIEFITDIKTTAGFYSDETILNFILFNVIENAIKYRNTSRHNCFVKIEIYNIENAITIRIEDNGIGIERENTNQIFDMYYRGNQYSSGPGLGLYIVQNGVKKLGGAINVRSWISEGSIFEIILPAQLVLMQ